MSRITVHQLVPSAVPGDATTAHTLQVQRLLRDLGYASKIYATAIHRDLEDRVRLVRELPRGQRRHFILYQLSSASPLADLLLDLRDPVAVNYHNITPASFFEGWDPTAVQALRSAAVQAAQVGRIASVGICDSAFNAADLRDKGWTSTTVAPILLDLADFEAEADKATADRLARRRDRGGADWLFVGALTPHKAQHRLVEALASYRATYDPAARLTLVGRPVCPPYATALARYVAALGLTGAVELTGGVSHEELVAHYEGADVLVSASEHEGFCVPLLEALHHDLPVVARAAGAVPDTLGPAGIALTDFSPPVVAAAVDRVLTDPDLRGRLARAGADRLVHFGLQRTRATMARALKAWVESGGEGTP